MVVEITNLLFIALLLYNAQKILIKCHEWQQVLYMCTLPSTAQKSDKDCSKNLAIQPHFYISNQRWT